MTAEFIPENVSVVHFVVPRYMVEPEKEVFRTCFKGVELICERLVVLIYVVGSDPCAVKSYTVFSRLVIIYA